MYSVVRLREELIDFSDTTRDLKKPYILSWMFKCTLEQDELDKGYVGLYTHGEMLNDPIYRQVTYSYCLSNAFKLQLRHNLKILWIDIRRATG